MANRNVSARKGIAIPMPHFELNSFEGSGTLKHEREVPRSVGVLIRDDKCYGCMNGLSGIRERVLVLRSTMPINEGRKRSRWTILNTGNDGAVALNVAVRHARSVESPTGISVAI